MDEKLRMTVEKELLRVRRPGSKPALDEYTEEVLKYSPRYDEFGKDIHAVPLIEQDVSEKDMDLKYSSPSYSSV
jgi:hypothetical protein